MLKIQMARCYPHMDNSSVLNGIIIDVEKHYNKMVEVVTKIEKAITSLKVSAGGHITEISELKNICEESQERITKLENGGRKRNFTEYVKDLDWIVKEKSTTGNVVKNCFEKMENTTSASINGGLENDLLRAAEADNIGEQMRIVRQISHRRKIDDFHKQITELKEENKKLREENIKLKQSQNSASNEEINRMIDSTINIMKYWNIQREGAK